jgi:hypothetical protein
VIGCLLLVAGWWVGILWLLVVGYWLLVIGWVGILSLVNKEQITNNQ